ncbi:MAG: THUMP domain-containing protein, partial [Acidimicrobiia bacterium]|nr:THUMP domain-containing protein [Acidimicrobiia bacterium]
MTEPKPQDDVFVRVVPSGEVYLKSRRTRDRFLRGLLGNLRAGLRRAGIAGSVRRTGHHEIGIFSADIDGAAALAARTFGVNRAEQVVQVEFESLEQLSKLVAEISRDQVSGRTFAVRVRRRGSHQWSSKDAEVEI